MHDDTTTNRAGLPVRRRDALKSTACGFAHLALTGLAAQLGSRATHIEAGSIGSPLAAAVPHHVPRAKRVIFIFMQGGPSQVDTFDPKPLLTQRDGDSVEFLVARTRQVSAQRLLKSPWSFRKYGECGQPVSSLFPHMAQHVDDLCMIHSMQTEGVAHGPATLFLHTGATNLVRPSVGSWVSYGLGTENENLPAFISLLPTAAKGGPRNYANAFLPTIHQGTAIGRAGVPTQTATIRHIRNSHLSPAVQRQNFDVLQALNHAQVSRRSDDDELDAVIASYELAYRMQSAAPPLMNLATETPETLNMYGIGTEPTDDFGRQCLLARRYAEAGVRYIQISYADNRSTPRWDQHSNLPAHEKHALAVDRPVAGLLTDLKQRGLLEDTLVWWGGEFGRTPFAQGRDGRDHNPKGFTVWLAGGGVRPGFAFGQTDEFGYEAVEQPVHMHDLHATLLHLLGLDHKRLTYRHNGRDFRLTDIAGRVVHEIIS